MKILYNKNMLDKYGTGVLGRLDFSSVHGRHLVVGLSGGADSVALVHLLNGQRPQIRLTAVHVEHGIRGQAALDDASFCERLCRRLAIPLYTEHVDAPAYARDNSVGLETAARTLRYRILRSVKSNVGADYIALAHHLDDQAETVLMHLFRGCGPEGISGMSVFSDDLYRPLLELRKTDLEEYLTAHGEVWCTDMTNALPDNPRNELRHNAIPAIRRIYPAAERAIVRYAEAAAVESDYLDRATDDYISRHARRFPWGFSLDFGSSFHPAVKRRALRKLLGRDLSHEHILAICSLDPGRYEIPKWGLAERSGDELYLISKGFTPPKEAALDLSGTTVLDGIGELEAVPSTPEPVRNDPFRQVLNAEALMGCVLRTRRPGDRIRPLGSGDKLLSDLFIDKKVPRPLRLSIPVVAKGDRILWAIGLCIAEEAKIRDRNDRTVMLRWRAY